MKNAERIVMVLLLLAIVGSGGWLYSAITSERSELREAVARGDFEIPDAAVTTDANQTQEDWRQYYPATIPFTIGSTTVAASVADSLPERIRGLSGTPYLPEGVVKLFVFDSLGNHAIWMKDMNYAIDIIWASKTGEVVHVEENITPDTYPESFSSPVESWYVVEAKAGFVAENNIVVGDSISVTR